VHRHLYRRRAPLTPPDRVASPPCACGRLRRATRALTQLYDDLLLPSSLRVTQFSLLRMLSRKGTTRISELAELLLLDRTALSRTLDPLVKRGLVSIVTGRDARTREVSLTGAGERAIRVASPHWKRAQQRVVSALGSERLEALLEALDAIEALHPDSGAQER
jgi:DNA-binding MarR family transcriptional regulator